MKTIFVQKSYNKFLLNIEYCDIPGYLCKTLPIDGIYKHHYVHKPTTYFLSATELNKEGIQFIEDISTDKNIKCFIIHDEYTDVDLYQILSNRCFHIFPSKSSIRDSSNSIYMPNNLINQKLFYNHNINKNDNIVIFLDRYSQIPDYLNKQLYPFNKINVTMFNNSNIQHAFNLGFLSEPDKAMVLNSSKYYACENDYYIDEAISCGCEILDFMDLKNKTVISKTINKTTDQTEFLRTIL